MYTYAFIDILVRFLEQKIMEIMNIILIFQKSIAIVTNLLK